MRNRIVYSCYIAALLFGFILGRFPQIPWVRYTFMVYLLVFFVFTGALPYLIVQLRKGDPGFVWRSIIKVVFPVVSLTGCILIVKILLKVGL